VFPEAEAQPAEGQTSPRITIDLQDLPLIEALRVILRAKNLAYRMEENLIWLTTPERMAAEKLVTKIYSLLRAVTGVVEIERPDPEEEDEDDEGRRLGQEEEGEEGETEETTIAAETVVATLEASIAKPEGSFMYFDERTGNLVVRNTLTNLAILEELIRQIEGAPMQVSIEARFITISTNELRQLGVEFPYLRIALGTKGSLDIDRDTGYGTDLSYVTGEGFTQGQGLALSYTKLNPTQFQMFLDAIEKTESINLLSAPRVMTRNQQEAEIKVVDEYRFAEDWETFYYIYYADFDGDGINEPHQGVTIVPSTFEDEPTEIGIILTVTPDIGGDMNITLKIKPIINEFLGWVVYGVGGQADDDIAENYVQLERIHESKIKTQIVVADGETIVMGGLIEEASSETLKKVPFLGDIPILGRLFSRTATTNDKKSLLIFITTHLVKPTGERYRI
jgi:type II secretory pathway component GspD/PulD (secretin)